MADLAERLIDVPAPLIEHDIECANDAVVIGPDHKLLHPVDFKSDTDRALLYEVYLIDFVELVLDYEEGRVLDGLEVLQDVVHELPVVLILPRVEYWLHRGEAGDPGWELLKFRGILYAEKSHKLLHEIAKKEAVVNGILHLVRQLKQQ